MAFWEKILTIVCITTKKYSGTSQLGMAQVQNGRLYTRNRSSSAKMKTKECKQLTEKISLLHCEIYAIRASNPSQDREN